MHFDPDNVTKGEWVTKRVAPFIGGVWTDDGASAKAYAFNVSEEDKKTCKELFVPIYEKHINQCAAVCGLCYTAGGSVRQVHNRRTLTQAWRLSGGSYDDVSKVCWMLFCSHNRVYDSYLRKDLAEVAQGQVMEGMNVRYVAEVCENDKKACVQRYFAIHINQCRNRIFGVNKQVKISFKNPLYRKGGGSAVNLTRTNGVKGGTFFYLGIRSDEGSREWEWEAVGKDCFCDTCAAGVGVSWY